MHSERKLTTDYVPKGEPPKRRLELTSRIDMELTRIDIKARSSFPELFADRVEERIESYSLEYRVT